MQDNTSSLNDTVSLAPPADTEKNHSLCQKVPAVTNISSDIILGVNYELNEYEHFSEYIFRKCYLRELSVCRSVDLLRYLMGTG